jgi:porphobilinogen deaminase
VSPDTSTAGVTRLAAEYDEQARMTAQVTPMMPDAHGGAVMTAIRQTAEDTAAVLRDLRDQRDALLAALQGLLEKVHCGTALECPVCDAARAAIAKAEGAL